MSLIGTILSAVGGESEAMIMILSVVKVAVLLGVALAVMAVLSRTRPDRRHMVLRLSLAAALLLPVLGIVMPPVEVDLLGAVLPSAGNLSSIMTAATSSETQTPVASAGWGWIDLVALIWVIGAVAVLAHLVRGLMIRSKILRESEPIESRMLLETIDERRRKMGIRRLIRVAVSTTMTGPVAWSFPKPTIVLSAEWATWSRHDSELAITHELCHIRRKDDIWMLVGALATAVHWFNPFVWLARNRMILEADNACDGYVVNTGADASAYASFMVALARRCHAVRTPVLVGTEIVGRRQLEERIMLIQSGRTQSVGVKRPLVRLAWTLVIAVCIPLAATRVTGNTAAAETIQASPETTTVKYPAPDSFVQADETPVAVNLVSPAYPDTAMKLNLEGSVWVQVLVDKAGKVADVRVRKTSGYDFFDKSALEAARKGDWKPAMQAGKPVAIWVTYEIRYKLKSDTTDAKGKK